MASVHKRTTSNGEARYDVRYRTPDATPRKETFRTRRDADRRAHAVEVDKSQGGWIDPRGRARPFGDVAAKWLTANPTKRESSQVRDESILREHIGPAFGARRIGSITPADIQTLVHGWNHHMAGSTVRRAYSTLRAVFSYAVADDLIARSPCRGIKLPTIAAVRCHVVTGPELAALADALGDNGPMAYLGAVIGLRWGEIAGLRVGRLDFWAKAVTVAEQLTRGENGRMLAAPPKSEAGQRTLGAPAWLMDMLTAHLAARDLTGADADELVFVAPKGGPLNYSTWRTRTWEPATKAAGLDGLRFHDLRRAAATALVTAGIDLKTAQARLGHSSPVLTIGVYAQASVAADRAATDALGAHFAPATRHERAIDAP